MRTLLLILVSSVATYGVARPADERKKDLEALRKGFGSILRKKEPAQPQLEAEDVEPIEETRPAVCVDCGPGAEDTSEDRGALGSVNPLADFKSQP